VDTIPGVGFDIDNKLPPRASGDNMAKLKRRHFILGSAGAVGALVVGWAALPQRQRLTTGNALPVAPGQVALNGWVKISSDNSVTVIMSQAEMGQGSHTGLAALLADELDASWDQIRLEQSTTDAIYNNQSAIIGSLPFQPDDHSFTKRATQHVVGKILREVPGLISTGGSSSITDQWWPMRQAGASARAMLIAAAAQLWNVPAEECQVSAGIVAHASGKKASFGELVVHAAELPIPKSVALKNPADYQFIGKPVRRIDNAAKLNGTAAYGIDALPDNLLYASIRMCPTLGGKVASFDAKAAQTLPGVKKVVALEPVPGGLAAVGNTSGGVAVIADTPFHAMRAVDAVEVQWDHGAAANVSSGSIFADMTKALDENKSKAHFERGDIDTALKSAGKIVSAEYRVPFLAHATMEPMNATAQFKDGKATIWTGTQAAGFTQNAVAKALKIKAGDVTVHIPFLGGGFGRRYFSEPAVQAALLSGETGGAPVQLIWSREQDMSHDYYRPAYLFRGKAGLDSAGKLVAWQTTSAGSSMGMPSIADTATDGASNTAYVFPAARIAHRTVESPMTMGIWRSVAHSQNGFFTESFIDECAVAASRDPIEFRRELLRENPRHLRVLERVAEVSKWKEPLADKTRARGLAIHRAFGSVVAQVAEVSISDDKQIRVHRVVCVIDCGFPVNPNLIRQQMEGAIVFGLSAALHGEITVDRGQVQQSNFHDYAPLRMSECPAIEVDIIPGTEHPSGVGEPGTPPIAPAVSNAVFALTGQRLRSLPLKLA
jgi:isoquinoline 1-oxidoreductase subunit beta